MPSFSNEQKSIFEIFTAVDTEFLIPSYQRPYEWGADECTALWDDLYSFVKAEDVDTFNTTDRYFLGPIVVFENNDKQLEVIDGQQRLTSIMILLRAFYTAFERDAHNFEEVRKNIENCLWNTDGLFVVNKSMPKLDSKVLMDSSSVGVFKRILNTGEIPEDAQVLPQRLKARNKRTYVSQYAENYNFFQAEINKYISRYPGQCGYMPARILRNCNLLVIKADSQDSALQIFSTLNVRGKPLTSSDIFKAKFYDYYSRQGDDSKNKFIERWRNLEDLCDGYSMDDLFTRYMHFLVAKNGAGSHSDGLQKFYGSNDYSLLNDDTLHNLELLAQFWKDVSGQNLTKFSTDVLKRLFVLNCSPNNAWKEFVSVYFLKNLNLAQGGDIENWNLDDEPFTAFLDSTIAFVLAYSVVYPGIARMRGALYGEMSNVVNDRTLFENCKIDRNDFEMDDIDRSARKSALLTKFILSMWAVNYKGQDDNIIKKSFQIEHIYAKKRVQLSPLANSNNLEALGNKSLLEDDINFNASCCRFDDKKKYYRGEVKNKDGSDGIKTVVQELLDMSDEKKDFTEKDIESRTEDMVSYLKAYLESHGLF